MEGKNDIITTAQGLQFSYAEIGAYLTNEAPLLIGKESTENLTFSQYNALFEVVGLHFFPTMKEFKNKGEFNHIELEKLARLYVHYCNVFSIVPSIVGFQYIANIDYFEFSIWISQSPNSAKLKNELVLKREEGIKNRLMSEYKTPIGSIAVANYEYKWNTYGASANETDRIASIDELPPLLTDK